jgi:putative sterol carrier protein
MATKEELREAVDDYIQQAQKSAAVQRSLKSWKCLVYFEAADIGYGFMMDIRDGSTTVTDGLQGTPDLIVRGSSEDLTNIFWCDENPASTYMQGAVKMQGSQEDTMKLDAMALMIYLEVKKAAGK